MKKEEKNQVIETLVEDLQNNKHFYLTDISGFDSEATSSLRRKCFGSDVKLKVVKNTLLRKAMERAEIEYDGLYDLLKGSTSIMFAETANVPAKIIKEFRKNYDKPILKGAYVEESQYIGDEQLAALASLKSKEELIGDIIGLLQSPAKNVISGLQASGGQKVAGILKTLSEKEN